MNGLELSRGYYEAYGKPMLERDFADLLPFLAVGFVGNGSEHFGFDDDISRDHDFEPGFCIFLPGEDVVDRRQAFALERAYAKLPKEFAGVKRQSVSPVGGNRNGMLRTAEFYLAAVGAEDGDLPLDGWLHIPDYALAQATNGEVFYDGYGEFTRIRQKLLQMPEDIRRKRLAGNLLIMAQAGQYNFVRCLRHGEPEAAQLACVQFVEAALKTEFLLQKKYLPFYKWSFRALRELDNTLALSGQLAFLLSGNNADDDTAEEKYNTIEAVCGDFVEKLQNDNLTQAICGDLEKHAYSVNDSIRDSNIRTMNIFTTV